jgi:hypothetical protein
MTLSQKFFGILSGLIMILAWATLILFTDERMRSVSGQAGVNTPLFVWIVLGPVPLFIGSGMSFFSKSQHQLAVFKAGVPGFLLWTMFMALFPGIGTFSKISPMFPTLGGYLVMIAFMMLFWWRSRMAPAGHPARIKESESP